MKQEETLGKTLIELKQSGIKFEENVEKQRQFISELQERAEKYKPEKTQTTMQEEIYFIYCILDGTSHRRELQTKIKSPKFDYFKTEKTKRVSQFSLKSPNCLKIQKSDVKLDVFELIVFELMANVKIILVENEDFNFHFEICAMAIS